MPVWQRRHGSFTCVGGRPASELHAETMARLDLFLAEGLKVFYIWEHEFKEWQREATWPQVASGAREMRLEPSPLAVAARLSAMLISWWFHSPTAWEPHHILLTDEILQTCCNDRNPALPFVNANNIEKGSGVQPVRCRILSVYQAALNCLVTPLSDPNPFCLF